MGHGTTVFDTGHMKNKPISKAHLEAQKALGLTRVFQVGEGFDLRAHVEAQKARGLILGHEAWRPRRPWGLPESSRWGKSSI